MTTVLNVIVTYDKDPLRTPTTFDIYYAAASQDFLPTSPPSYGFSGTIGSSDPTNNVFPTIQDAINYSSATAITNIVNQANVKWGAGTYSEGGLLYNITQENKDYLDAKVSTSTTVNGHALTGNVAVSASDVGLGNVNNTSDANKPVSTATQTALNLKANTSSLATVATSGAYADLSGLPTIPTINAKSFSTPTRTIGTAFQISSTRDSFVSYSVPVTAVAGLVVGAQAAMTCQYADNSGMTTNVVTVPGDAFGVGTGLVVTCNGTMKINAFIPAGKFVKLTTTNVLGTPTIGAVTAQEVLV